MKVHSRSAVLLSFQGIESRISQIRRSIHTASFLSVAFLKQHSSTLLAH